jgi:DNA-binding transcriptional LysR family regulator
MTIALDNSSSLPAAQRTTAAPDRHLPSALSYLPGDHRGRGRRVQLELASNEAIRTAVESGVCATAISNLVVKKSVAAKTLFQLEGELAKRSFYVLRHKERHISKAGAALLASITAAR